MTKIIFLIVALANIGFGATTYQVKENLKKNFGKHTTYQIRLTIAKEVICTHMSMCESPDPITYSFISNILVISKTYSETIRKELTLMTLNVSLDDLGKRCIVQMKLKPQQLYVSPEGDLEKLHESWSVTKATCRENQIRPI